MQVQTRIFKVQLFEKLKHFNHYFRKTLAKKGTPAKKAKLNENMGTSVFPLGSGELAGIQMETTHGDDASTSLPSLQGKNAATSLPSSTVAKIRRLLTYKTMVGTWSVHS